MNNRVLVMILASLAIMGQPALSHHSNAMFDQETVLEMSGTVKEFQFTNPHTWVQVMVEDDQGEVVEWSLGMGLSQ